MLSSAFSWQRLATLLLGIVVLHFVFGWIIPRSPFSQYGSALPSIPGLSRLQSHNGLRTDLHNEIVDELTTAQCEELFPKLYYEVDRATSYWRSKNHQISPQDIDITYRSDPNDPAGGGALKILIHENELRIVESRNTNMHLGYHSRGMAFLALLDIALKSATAAGEILPTIEAVVVLEDVSIFPTPDGTTTLWAFNANMTDPTHDRLWLVPNFDFYGAGILGSYRQARRRARQRAGSWTSKIPQVVWRGALFNNAEVRGALRQVTMDKPWADVKQPNGDKTAWLTPDQMCRYAMTVHTEGFSYSGRLKYLLNCDALTFVHELKWRTHYYHLLEEDGPNQNYVQTKRDFSDLEEKVEYYLSHPQEAERIVSNAVAAFRDRYLTPAAQSCYLRKLIQGYSTVSHSPNVYRPMQNNDELPMPRGRAFEDYMQSIEDFTEEEA